MREEVQLQKCTRANHIQHVMREFERGGAA